MRIFSSSGAISKESFDEEEDEDLAVSTSLIPATEPNHLIAYLRLAGLFDVVSLKLTPLRRMGLNDRYLAPH